MNHTQWKYIRLRIGIVGAFFLLIMGGIAFRSVQVLIYRSNWLSQEATRQVERSYIDSGKRGSIFDACHREIAGSVEVTSIAANPREIEDKAAVSRALGKALSLDSGVLKQRLDVNRSFVWIKRKVSPREARAVREIGLQGVAFVTEASRFYPGRSLAAQVVGFSGVDGHGLEGIEFYYDQELKGKMTEVTFLTDAFGKRFDSGNDLPPDTSGNNLILTIDSTIQQRTQKALSDAVATYKAASGIAIVMEPRSGAILAMANCPEFNPNNYSDYSRHSWLNRAISHPFEPGSTMKIFSAAAAIEAGGCTRKTIFFCENGKYRVGRNTVHDVHPNGWLSLEHIIKFSSNIGAVKVSEAIGPEVLHTTLKNFGFGSRTGIDCPGETIGILSDPRRWSRIDTGAIAFGQGISVSAIQLISAVSAIANDGILMKPFLVQAITDRNGRLVNSFEPTRVRRVISVETARAVRAMMQTVTEEGGTGVNAALESYPVAGKTGTAQKSENGVYVKGKFTSSFVGFTPVEDPVIAILVIIDEPRGAHYASVVAAPVFKEIANGALTYLNIAPSGSNRRLTASGSSEVSG